MAFKYKLKEVEIGDTKVSKGVKYTVRDIDPDTGTISWKVDYVPAFDSTFKEFQELRQFMTKLSRETKDETIDSIADDVRKLFNQYRTHLRKNYPEEYKQMTMTEEVEEISTSAGAGAYLGKYAFRKKGSKPNDKAYTELGYEEVNEDTGATMGPGPKASEEGVKDNYYVKKFKYKLVPKDKNGNYVQKGSGLEVKNF